MGKTVAEFIPGEKLNVIFGARPLGQEKEDQRSKAAILQLLFEKYGIREEDFLSADLEVVPAGKARDIGLDRALIGGYGHDDRVCVFASLKAILDADTPEKPALVLLMDKEEIGSEGATGSNTWFLEMVMGEILAKNGNDQYQQLRRLLAKASCLSADVNAAVHPDWAEVHDKRNAGYLGGGLVISKFTGTGGKGGSNEANAEFVAVLRKIFAEADVTWHMAELGKIDEGGGGTIAKFMSYYGMNVIDAGVAVLDMHSPFEIVSKIDTWNMYRAFKAFLEKA
jgi:aspartyl aminopeptidase